MWAYRLLHLAAIGWILIGLIRMVVLRFSRRRKRVGGLTMTDAAWLPFGAIIISRTLLVVYIDAMSFGAQLRYMLPIYPTLIGMA